MNPSLALAIRLLTRRQDEEIGKDFFRRNFAQGLEGYLRRNAAAIKLVEPGGFFVTSSCSSYLSWDGFWSMIQRAALRAERAIRILAHGSQAPDHPILPALRKTAYLKCLFLRVD
jgi:23S rRNA (cytosine1962-C5)-methyltransferase